MHARRESTPLRGNAGEKGQPKKRENVKGREVQGVIALDGLSRVMAAVGSGPELGRIPAEALGGFGQCLTKEG